jgi:hypothetical protein
MNVVTANQMKDVIDKLDIDIIKRIDGQYELNELLGKFVNLYFNKMIIDVTSIVNYKDFNTIAELAKNIDPSRLILLLNNEPEVNSPLYTNNLIQNKIYNFTHNYEGIKYLYENPNTYENVKHLVLTPEQVNQVNNPTPAVVAAPVAVATEVANTNDPTVYVPQASNEMSNVRASGRRIIVGLQNLTNHAGSTSLANMMVRQLISHGIPSIGIEMFRQDFLYYHSSYLFSCMNKYDVESLLKKNEDKLGVIVDLNDFGEADQICDVVIYLVEPSYVMLTKLLKKNKNAFAEMKDKVIILNKSFVNEQEMDDFEFESKCKVYMDLPCLNDRNENISEINELLIKLGFFISNDGE